MSKRILFILAFGLFFVLALSFILYAYQKTAFPDLSLDGALLLEENTSFATPSAPSPYSKKTIILTPFGASSSRIEIRKAEHLDGQKRFVSDIFQDVRVLDHVWSEVIPRGHYVRVVFEQPLNLRNDITLYTRVVDGNPRIAVYERGKDKMVAEFTNLGNEGHHQVYLSALEGEQDAFDLFVEGGSLQFDYITDPQTTLVPANWTQNVSSGYVTELTYTFGSMSPVDDACYSAINVSGGNSCLESEGTGTRDAYFLWNVTLLNYTVVTSVNITVVMSNTNGLDRLNLSLYNYTAATFQSFDINKTAATSGTNITLQYNVTAISNFVLD